MARLSIAEASDTPYHERLPRIGVIQYRLNILWACLSAMTLNDPRWHYSFQSTLLCTGTHDNGCWCLHPRFCGLCSSDVRGICILCLDFRTAFDKVSHDYLYNILSENGFDDTSVGIPRVLYKNATFSYDVNGVPIGALFDWMFATIGMPVKRDHSIVLYI